MLKKVVCFAAMMFAANLMRADEFSEQRLANWHQFRGPEATGVAPRGNPPTEWSEAKNIQWKVAIPGKGSASPIVWGDRIFVLSAIKTDRTADSETAASGSNSAFRLVADTNQASPSMAHHRFAQNRERGEGARGGGGGRRSGDGGGRSGFGGGRFGGGEPPMNYYQFVVHCLDRNTGQALWRKIATEVVPHEGHHDTGSFASASPVTDGKHLWVSFGSRGIYCYDLDGNRKWHKDLGDMRTRLAFGEGASPALHEDTLVINWDHEDDSFIVALDALTGDEKWRNDRDEITTWATPLIVEHKGRTQVITSGETRVRSYDLETSELIWECGGQGSNPIATPVATDDLVICVTGHRDPAGYAIPLDSRGDITGTDKIAWRTSEGTPYVSTPLLYDGLLYYTKSRNAILSCVNAETGEVYVDQKRLPDLDSIYASPVGAAGKVYFSSREGMTVVLKHGREFEVLAKNQLDETIDASPAIVGDKMYIRGDTHLYCIAEE